MGIARTEDFQLENWNKKFTVNGKSFRELSWLAQKEQKPCQNVLKSKIVNLVKCIHPRYMSSSGRLWCVKTFNSIKTSFWSCFVCSSSSSDQTTKGLLMRFTSEKWNSARKIYKFSFLPVSKFALCVTEECWRGQGESVSSILRNLLFCCCLWSFVSPSPSTSHPWLILLTANNKKFCYDMSRGLGSDVGMIIVELHTFFIAQ